MSVTGEFIAATAGKSIAPKNTLAKLKVKRKALLEELGFCDKMIAMIEGSKEVQAFVAFIDTPDKCGCPACVAKAQADKQ